LFLDDDDVLEPNALTALQNVLAANPAAVAVVGGYTQFSDEGTFHPPMWWRRFVRPPWLDAVAGWCGLTGQTLFRTQALRAVGGFDPELNAAEDQELWMRMGKSPVAFTPRRVFRQRAHPGQGQHGNDSTAQEAEMRARLIATLSGAERLAAERAMRLWSVRRTLIERYMADDGAAFRRELQAAISIDRSLALSPLLRPGLGRMWLKSFAGGSVRRTLRRARRTARLRL
jgi:hypothetical protein